MRLPEEGGSGSCALPGDTFRSISPSGEVGMEASGFPRSCPGKRLSVDLGLRTDGFADAFECGDALSGDGLEAFFQRLGVVGDEFGPVSGARYLDVKRLRRAQLGMVRLHRGDDVVHRAPLKGVHGRGPGAIEMAQLGLAGGQCELAAFLQNERHPPVPDPEYLGGGAVYESQPLVVPGPAYPVAGAKLDCFGAVDLGPAPTSADPGRLPVHDRALRAFQPDGSTLAIDAQDTPLLALLDPEPPVGAVEGDHVAGRVVGRERLLPRSCSPWKRAAAS